MRQVLRCRFSGGRDRPSIVARPQPPPDAEPPATGGNGDQPLDALCIRLKDVLRCVPSSIIVDPHPDADPDSTYHPDADPDADPDSDVLFDAGLDPTFHPDADPDPDPAYKKARILEKC